MKVLLSPLVLHDFAIINTNFKFIDTLENTDIRQIVSSYPIDVDFAIVEEEQGTKVFMKASINRSEKPLSGYSIFAEGVAVFDVSKTAKLSTADKKSLLQYSAVSITLNSLRGFIATLTSNAPFGRYILPSIDVNDLFKQKTALTKEKSIKKKK